MNKIVEKLLESPDIKIKIIESLRKTRDTKKEHVFNFCTINEEMITTDIEEGKEHTVGNDSICPIGKIIGAFHTHTRLTKDEDVVPSPRDIIKSVVEELDFFCVGGNKGDIGIVRCFDVGMLLLEMNAILEIMKKSVNEENVHRASRHVVGHMLKDRKYLNAHSYTRLYSMK